MFRPQKCLKVDLLPLRYCDLHELRDKYEPAESMQRLDEWCSITPNTSEEKVFRCTTAVDKDRMHTNPSLPSRHAERPETGRAWRDLDEAEAEERVMRGESLLVLGIAGTGKTTFMQGIVKRLRHSGKRVDVISKTHSASRRAGGVTAGHWVRRHVLHGAATYDYLWIDEISQVDVCLLNQLGKLTFTSSTSFLLSGDHHQFPAINNC